MVLNKILARKREFSTFFYSNFIFLCLSPTFKIGNRMLLGIKYVQVRQTLNIFTGGPLISIFEKAC